MTTAIEPTPAPARATGWGVIPAAFAHARGKQRGFLTYAEWDRVFGELADVPMPAVLGEALSRRKAHLDEARAAEISAEDEAAAWRREAVVGRWHARNRLRARARAAAADRLRRFREGASC